jgi:hypothetical protein
MGNNASGVFLALVCVCVGSGRFVTLLEFYQTLPDFLHFVARKVMMGDW